jgi:hypothetical protein
VATEPVKIAVPIVGDDVDRETCWAVPVDVAAGTYRVDNVLFFTDGLGVDDVVRCQPNAWLQLVAVEVVSRSPRTTLLFWRCDDEPFPTEEAHTEALGDLLAAVGDRLGDDTHREGGFGMLAVAVEPDRLEVLLDLVTATAGGQRDDTTNHAGEWVWTVVTSPDLPAGVPLEGADLLLDEPGPDLVAVHWPSPDDALVAGWPEGLVDELREIAAYDDRVRAALDERRYLPVVAMLVREHVSDELGHGEVGPQPFALFPSLAPEDCAEDRADWIRSRVDGRTRWAVADAADAEVRALLERFGLDPDGDPYEPVGAPP